MSVKLHRENFASIKENNLYNWLFLCFSMLVFEILFFILVVSFVYSLFFIYNFRGVSILLLLPAILFVIYLFYTCFNIYIAYLFFEKKQNFPFIYKNFLIFIGTTTVALISMRALADSNFFVFSSSSQNFLYANFFWFFVPNIFQGLPYVTHISIAVILLWILTYRILLKFEYADEILDTKIFSPNELTVKVIFNDKGEIQGITEIGSNNSLYVPEQKPANVSLKDWVQYQQTLKAIYQEQLKANKKPTTHDPSLKRRASDVY